MVLLVLLLKRVPALVGLQCRKDGRVRLGLGLVYVLGSIPVPSPSPSSPDRELAEESSSRGGCGSMVILCPHIGQVG